MANLHSINLQSLLYEDPGIQKPAMRPLSNLTEAEQLISIYDCGGRRGEMPDGAIFFRINHVCTDVI